MDYRHDEQDERRGRERGQMSLRDTREGGRTEDTSPTENDQEECGIKILPAVERSCHDRPFSQGEMGVDRQGHVLVVRERKTEQKASVQGVQSVGERDQGVVGNDWEDIRKKRVGKGGGQALQEQEGVRLSC